MTIVIVNKNDNLFSTDCQRAVSGRFTRSVPAPQPPTLPFSATPATPDFRPLRSRSVHLVPPGLLQLTAVRHQRRAPALRAVGPERSGAPSHWRPKV